MDSKALIPSRFVKQLIIEEGSVVEVIAPKVESFQQPNQFSQVQCSLQQGVFARVQSVQRSVEKNLLWIKISCGWVIATDGGEEAFVRIVSDLAVAYQFWHNEKQKRERMASAVAAMLVRSYSLPRAKRLARSLLLHAQAHYPHTPMSMSMRRSIEDAMIALGGLSALSKAQVFEFIKTAAAMQSDPPQSVVQIAGELCDLVCSRPTLWVVENKNVLTTEEIRMRNNQFVMCAAEGELESFEKFLQHGQELTSLHSELMYTALHAAADFGQITIVARIIETGLSLNIRDPKRGQTALHFAAHNGRKEVVALLLAAGADRQIHCARRILPFQVADQHGHVECCEMLKLVPPPVPILEATEVSRHTMSWLWTAPFVDLRTTPVVEEYCLEMQLVDMMEDLRDPPLTYTSLLHSIVNGLTPARTYRGRVRCRAASGWSAWSAWVLATTLAHAPETPQSVEILKTSINALLLHWFPPVRDHGRAVDFYELEVADVHIVQNRVAVEVVLVDEKSVPLRNATGAALCLSDGQERGLSAISKHHRLLKHKAIDNLKKYITGLEPGKLYKSRVRAHNECGFSAWSEWSHAVAPRVGVSVKSFDTERSAVTLEWFHPALSSHRKLKCFELQVCRLKGPPSLALNTAQFVNGKIAQQSVQAEEDYVTVANSLIENEFTLFPLRAGGRYQVRVRFNADPGGWLDWEDALKSDPFTLPAAPPDPPVNVLPRCIKTSREDRVLDKHDVPETQCSRDIVGDNNCDDVTTVAHILARSFTDELTVNDVIDVTHDHITIQWVNGDSNGEEITDYEVQLARIRSYNVRDVVFAKDAFIGIAEDDNFTFKANNTHIPSDSQRISDSNLSWKTVNEQGIFVGPQAFKMPNLRPGHAYAFRVRQRNSCGWSSLSKSSPLICTYPSLPPGKVTLLSVGATSAVLCWEGVDLDKPALTTLEFEVQIRYCGMNTEGEEDDFFEWKAATTQPLSHNDISSFCVMDTSVPNHRTGCKLLSLVEAQWYEARLRIRTVIGWSPWSCVVERFRTLR